MHTQDFETHSFMGKLSLTLGTILGGLTFTTLDLWLSLFLKFISIASFVCYLMLNWPVLKDRSMSIWKKIKALFGKDGGI